MPAPSLEEMLATVGLVYEAALDPGAAPRAMDGLGSLLRSRGAQLCTWDRASGEVLHAQVSSDPASRRNNELYVNEWGRHDPKPRATAALASGAVLRCHDHFDEKFVAGNPYYQEFSLPAGYRWALGGIIHSADGTSTIVAALRAPDAPRYEDWAAAALRMLLPHFERAIALRSKLAAAAAERSDLSRFVAALPAPALAVDAGGRVLLLNAAAQAALATLQADLSGRFLRFRRRAVAALWQQALQQVHAGGAAATLSTAPQGWKLHVIPWRTLSRASDAFELGLNLVTFEWQGPPGAPQAEALARQARLTRAESEVLALILRGHSTEEIARVRGGSFHTVRSQVRAILEKTGCHSQRELLARATGQRSG